MYGRKAHHEQIVAGGFLGCFGGRGGIGLRLSSWELATARDEESSFFGMRWRLLFRTGCPPSETFSPPVRVCSTTPGNDGLVVCVVEGSGFTLRLSSAAVRCVRRASLRTLTNGKPGPPPPPFETGRLASPLTLPRRWWRRGTEGTPLGGTMGAATNLVVSRYPALGSSPLLPAVSRGIVFRPEYVLVFPTNRSPWRRSPANPIWREAARRLDEERSANS